MEFNQLLSEVPATLGGPGEDIQPIEDENLEDQDDTQDDDDTDTEEDDTSEEDDTADDTGDGDVTDKDDDEDEDFIVSLGDEEDNEDKTPPADNKPAPAGAPKLDYEGQYILDNLPKIKTNVLVTGADGKDVSRSVEVYGWGQLRQIPGLKGFASEVDQTDFLLAAQRNESTAKELQGTFRAQRTESDMKAYTMRENRAIAKDLKDLRGDSLFPKFKGVPGSKQFNDSEGAKMFDEVVAFMNEQNDEAGQAANKGEAFFHISFKQAYRMLHPEVFNKQALANRKKAEQNAARRVKSGAGTKPTRGNVRNTRVTNINDLADEFAAFVGKTS